MLKPEVIWDKLKLDRLRQKNLWEGDFFNEVTRSRAGEGTILDDNFDVILGNPPFESDLTSFGRDLNEEVVGTRGELPDKQAAYLFLEQGIEQLKPTGRLCLIQPSGILHNSNAFSFRQRVMRQSKVETVLDFTSIRNLYEAADPKTVALVVRREKPAGDHRVSHLTFRRTFGTRERIVFEIDHYDWHYVPQHFAESDPFVWRLDLLGGGRLVAPSKRFREMRTLEEFIRANGFRYSEGFMVGHQNTQKSFLTGMRYLPPEGLTDGGIDHDALDTVKETDFQWPRSPSIYEPPLILIRKNERLQIGFWDDGPLAYTSTLVGIGSKSSQRHHAQGSI